MAKKQLQGQIVSDKMTKTVVVEVERIKAHPKYKKRYKISKKYKAHVEDAAYKLGDWVVIEETKPISKDKTWKVISKIRSGIKEAQEEVAELQDEIAQENPEIKEKKKED